MADGVFVPDKNVDVPSGQRQSYPVSVSRKARRNVHPIVPIVVGGILGLALAAPVIVVFLVGPA